MTDLVSQVPTLEVPRGDLDSPPLLLDMTKIYQAENRISEIRVANLATAADLQAVFNEACNTGNKYVAWLKYEILRAKRNFDLAKATVMIDKLPLEVAKLKEAGMKDNADFRSAIIDKDPECRSTKDVLDVLEATKTFIEVKVKSFERSYWDTKEHAKKLMGDNTIPPGLSVEAGPSSFSVPSSLEQTEQSDQADSKEATFSFIGVSKF